MALENMRRHPTQRMLLERILEVLCLVHGGDNSKKLLKHYLPGLHGTVKPCSHKHCPDHECRVAKSRKRFAKFKDG